MDATMVALTAKSGYNRNFVGGVVVTGTPTTLVGVLDGYCYGAAPSSIGQTGVRGFGGDASGRVCQNITGTTLCTVSSLAATCTVIQ